MANHSAEGTAVRLERGEDWYGSLPRILSELGVGVLVANNDGAVLVNDAFASLTGYSVADLLAMGSFDELWGRLAPSLIGRGHRRLSGQDEPQHYEADLAHRDGHSVPVEVHAQLVIREGGVEIVTIFRDLTDRRRVESELAVHARQQAAVAELGRRALSDPDISSLMNAAVAVVAQTLDVEFASVGERLPGGQTLLVRAAVGMDEDQIGHATIGAGIESQAGYTIVSDGPVVVDDVADEARFNVGAYARYRAASGVTVVIRADGGPYGVLGAFCTRPRRFGNEDVYFLATVANVLAVALARARVEVELATRVRQQATLAELGRRALADSDLSHLMDATVDAVSETLDVEYAEVLKLQPGGQILLLQAGVGWADDRAGEVTVPSGPESHAGYTLASPTPVVMAELATETRFRAPPRLRRHGVVSGVSVIILGPDRPWGVLGVHTSRRRHFSADDIHFLQATANTLAVGIRRAEVEHALRSAGDKERRLRQRLQAYSRAAVDAQEAERRHLARELHDEIGQVLTGLKLLLENRDRALAAPAPERLDRARDLVAELLVRVHDLSLDLRPAMLDDLGLRPALLWLVPRYSAQTGVEVDLECADLARRLRPEVETAAYRIVQEALTNVARHARVASATVCCALQDESLRIEVRDSGVGFEVDAVRPRESSGLVGMEERARATGGRLRLVSAAGRGTIVVAELPLAGHHGGDL